MLHVTTDNSLELSWSAARIRAAGLALLFSGSLNSSKEFATTLIPIPSIPVSRMGSTIISDDPSAGIGAGEKSG